jgi:High potential iron-sulfur protein
MKFQEHTMMLKTRRQFVQIFPLAGLGLLAACGDKKPAPSAAAPAPTPAAPAPAPAAPAAAPAAPAAAAPAAPAADLPMVAAGDATALALGYVSDASQVDKTKYAQYVPGSKCSNCSLYQGAAGSAAGGCPLFPGKQVSANGWSTAYVKKAA